MQSLPEPNFTVFKDGRLRAYIWRRPGTLHLAKKVRSEGQRSIPTRSSTIRCFDVETYSIMKEIIPKSRGLAAVLFKLGLEGFDVEKGAVTPDIHRNRF